MAIFIKVYKKNNKIVIDNGVKRNEYAAPANVSYSAVNVPGLRSPDRVTLKAFGLPVVTDKAVDVFCDEAGNKISVDLVLAELLTYFDSLGMAQNSGGGGGDLTDYYTKEQVDQLLQDIVAGEVDLSNYVTVEQLATTLQSYPTNTTLASYYTSQQTNAAIANSLVAYYTKTQADSLLAGKVDKQPNARLITDAEATKLAGLDSNHFKGEFISLSALQAAKPTAVAGDYAYVDAGVGANTLQYNWDTSDNQWVQASSTGTSETPASIKSKYESNANTNAFTDLAKTTVANTSGVNSGDETAAGIRSKLGITTLSGNNTGDETATTIINKIGNGSTINSQYLPAYVDDVLEGTYVSATVFNNEQGSPYALAKGVIYVDTTSNFEYRYSGTALVKLVASPGTTDDVPEGATNKYFTDARALSATATAIAGAAGFQAETTAYQNRIRNISGAAISAADLLALDTFVLAGKTGGWWSAVKFFAPMMGNNLITSLVKFVVDASGVPSLGNVNFVEADYSPQLGFNLTANTNKRFTTSFIPSDNGITPNNIGALVCTPQKTPGSGGSAYLVCDSNSDTSGKFPRFYFDGAWSSGQSWGIPSAPVTGSLFSLSPGGMKTQILVSINGASAFGYTNGISANTGTGVATSTAVLATEISIFGNLFGGTYRYTAGSYGGLLFTTGLTTAQSDSLARAYYILNRTIRRAHYESPLFAWFGDSIFGWIGSPTLGIPAIAGGLLSAFELNFGTPSSKVVGINTFNAAIPMLTRYLEVIRNGYGMSSIGIMGGINDLLTDANANGTTALITAYQAALLTIYNAFKLVVPKVIAVGIPYNTTVSTTKMNAYNAANVAAVVSANLVYVDSFNIYLDSNNTASELLPDGTHPSLIYATLIAEHTAAAVMGKIYRDVKIPATLVAANSAVTFPVTMIGLRRLHVMQTGESQVTNTGIVFTSAWASDNNALITIRNTTGADITTAATNVRLLFFLNF